MKRFDPPRHTYSDYVNWKEDWELIQGYPYPFLPSAKKNHSRKVVKFIVQADKVLQNNSGCNCEIFQELDWKIDEETILRPDMVVVCGESQSDFLDSPPVLVLEVISSSLIVKNRKIKFEIYENQGVKYYLMADYIKKSVEVYEWLYSKNIIKLCIFVK